MAGRGEQTGDRIADDRAAAMAHMHRPGRVGGHVFHIHRLAAANVAEPVVRAGRKDDPWLLRPEFFGKPQIDEARARHLHGLDVRVALQRLRDLVREIARLRLERLRQNHGGIGGDVAMRGIARRFRGDAIERVAGRPEAVRADHRREDVADALLELGKEVHRGYLAAGAPPCPA